MNDFKLIKELGLEVINASKIYANEYGHAPRVFHVNAEDLEALLEKGKRVYGQYGNHWMDHTNPSDTDTGLLINIRPIQKDTADSLLRERVEFHTLFGDRTCTPGEKVWLERARKVLNAAATKKP